MSLSIRFLVALVPLVFGSACTPALTPIYRDYRAAPREAALEKAKTAFLETGWELTNGPAIGVIITQEKKIRDFQVYKILVQLEATMFQSRFVRVYVNAYRKYLISGHKGKIPYMERHVIQEVLRPLEVALKKQGLELEKRIMDDEKNR